MKPKEFDELIRQKFDQNDFEYNPKNWESLAEELDGRSKKRSAIVWWWMPLAGVAASVAFALVMPLVKHEIPGNTVAKTELVQKHITVQAAPVDNTHLVAEAVVAAPENHGRNRSTGNNKHNRIAAIVAVVKDKVEIQYHEPVVNAGMVNAKGYNLLTAHNKVVKEKEKEAIKRVEIVEGVNTFKSEKAVASVPKLSIILSGGLNRGNQINGYMAGATIRRMVNDKVFVEGDIAFANSNNSQTKEVEIPGSTARHSGAKIANPEGDKLTVVTPQAPDVIKETSVSYNLSYAQITPSIGYKLMKRMSVAVGPDFQQLLVDNRPAPSTVDKGTLQEAASFDVGFIGKSEYAITRNIKAAVSYRKGVNTIITPTDKYLDRDYLQFQVKCAIFNK